LNCIRAAATTSDADGWIADDGSLDASRTFVLYPARAGETMNTLKIKRNNVNRYACRRINGMRGNCTSLETEY
jgi:hypothetical protein